MSRSPSIDGFSCGVALVPAAVHVEDGRRRPRGTAAPRAARRPAPACAGGSVPTAPASAPASHEHRREPRSELHEARSAAALPARLRAGARRLRRRRPAWPAVVEARRPAGGLELAVQPSHLSAEVRALAREPHVERRLPQRDDRAAAPLIAVQRGTASARATRSAARRPRAQPSASPRGRSGRVAGRCGRASPRSPRPSRARARERRAGRGRRRARRPGGGSRREGDAPTARRRRAPGRRAGRRRARRRRAAGHPPGRRAATTRARRRAPSAGDRRRPRAHPTQGTAVPAHPWLSPAPRRAQWLRRVA